VCAAAQVLKGITAGLFMNAAQYQCTEYDPTKTNDAGSNVYRLLRHVQPRKCLPETTSSRTSSSTGSSKKPGLEGQPLWHAAAAAAARSRAATVQLPASLMPVICKHFSPDISEPPAIARHLRCDCGVGFHALVYCPEWLCGPLFHKVDNIAAGRAVLCHAAGRPLKLRIHPSSVLFRTQPQLVVFLSCQQNDEGWYEMQGVTAIQPDWLTELAPGVFQKR
jgi:hypothetical protein